MSKKTKIFLTGMLLIIAIYAISIVLSIKFNWNWGGCPSGTEPYEEGRYGEFSGCR